MENIIFISILILAIIIVFMLFYSIYKNNNKIIHLNGDTLYYFKLANEKEVFFHENTIKNINYEKNEVFKIKETYNYIYVLEKVKKS